jgi:AhpD family alkylhydroperoxidase
MSVGVEVRRHAAAAYDRQREFDRAAWAAFGDRRLAELMKIRVSQLNGCGFCLELHCRGARLAGVTDRELFTVAAWRESALFDERDRALLALAEASVAPGHPAPDADALAAARRHLSEPELAGAVLGLAAINAWNRIALASGSRFPRDDAAADELARQLTGAADRVA